MGPGLHWVQSLLCAVWGASLELGHLASGKSNHLGKQPAIPLSLPAKWGLAWRSLTLLLCYQFAGSSTSRTSDTRRLASPRTC